MNHDERLFERISSQEREPLRRGGHNRKRGIDSVIDHLQRILNTRQGNVPIAADYGIPDFLHFLQTYPDSVQHIEESIRIIIGRYEPRLSGISVTFMPRDDHDLTLCFQVIASMGTEEVRYVHFETVLAADGRVRVRG
jgi:type VI secretion system protein